MLHCGVWQPLLSLCPAWASVLPLALSAPEQGNCLKQAVSQAGVCLCQGSSGDLFLSTQGSGENRMRLYNLQLHGAFHPKGLLTSEATDRKGIIHPPLRGIHHWKAASFKQSSAAFPNCQGPRVGKRRDSCAGLDLCRGWVGRVHRLIWFLNPTRILELLWKRTKEY